MLCVRPCPSVCTRKSTFVHDHSLTATVNTMCWPLQFSVVLMLFTHASDAICVWSSGTSPALFEERSSWWSSDLQTGCISLPVSAYSQPSERPCWPCDAHCSAEKTLHRPTVQHRLNAEERDDRKYPLTIPQESQICRLTVQHSLLVLHIQCTSVEHAA